MSALRLALVQMRCEKGTVAANLESIDRYLREAAGRDADIVCFPEAAITGYLDPTRYPDVLLRLDGPEVARFLELTRGVPVAVLAGLIEANPAGKPFITQVVACDGALLARYRKRTIPPDEAHLFAPGSDPATFIHAGVPCGLTICADIDDAEIFAVYARGGARVVFECAAPGLYGPQETRDWGSGHAWWRGECASKLGRYARAHGLHIAVATQAGRTRDEDFPGGGYVFGPDGACLAATPDWSEGVLYAAIAPGARS